MTSENVAEKYGISREQQDRFAFASQTRCAYLIAVRLGNMLNCVHSQDIAISYTVRGILIIKPWNKYTLLCS